MRYITDKNISLLDALGELMPESSRSTLRKLLKFERVTVDGKIEKNANLSLKKGQEVAIKPKEKVFGEGIKILYEDKHLIVIEKPEGLLSVATDFEKERCAHGYLKEKYRPTRVFPVHRLDQETSGVMLFAFTEEARDKLKVIFEKHEIEREYSALCEGIVTPNAGTWRSYLYEDEVYRVHSTNDKTRGRLAITHYRVEKVSKRASLLTLALETGRKNQIRVHCQDAGHSILGDKKYGATSNPFKRVCLHAHRLNFSHPITGKPMRFETTPPFSL